MRVLCGLAGICMDNVNLIIRATEHEEEEEAAEAVPEEEEQGKHFTAEQ